ncbi:unnamed protein product [Notodromas monacha]|uniref:Uncharacterized protein n=1 Tax=Notodromas monacha TaxID=399045 RepID=A0A7R9GJG3_9CRUS|nr:unnamed protein product [Notodromas monacha]CAG0923528.1 unnamed protein product [Notodromas monacha]
MLRSQRVPGLARECLQRQGRGPEPGCHVGQSSDVPGTGVVLHREPGQEILRVCDQDRRRHVSPRQYHRWSHPEEYLHQGLHGEADPRIRNTSGIFSGSRPVCCSNRTHRNDCVYGIVLRHPTTRRCQGVRIKKETTSRTRKEMGNLI